MKMPTLQSEAVSSTISQQPNILWICAEHHRFDAVHALGNPHIRTPNLDRLVAEGTAFTHAYCQSPVCTPSRASFLTGRYPVTTRCRQNGQNISETECLLPRYLANNGYRCGLSGKLHVGAAASGSEKRIDDGYELFCWSHGATAKHGGMWIDWLHSLGHRFEDIYRPSTVIQSREVSDSDLHQTTWCVDRALEWIQSINNTPWMLSLNPFAAHDPFDFLREYYDRYNPEELPLPLWRDGELDAKPALQKMHSESGSGFDMLAFGDTTPKQRREMIAAYYATIEHMDAEIGRLIDWLDKSGQRDNTIIVYTADHGEMLGDHGIFAKGPFFYEPAVRVPLILSCPGTIDTGLCRDALVELTDIFPTLCDLVGLPIPEAVQGRAFTQLLSASHREDSHREGVYSEFYNASPVEESGPVFATMWRDNRYKVVIHHNNSLGELYDLVADPSEFRNLWDDSAHQEVLFTLISRAFDASVFTMDPLPSRLSNF